MNDENAAVSLRENGRKPSRSGIPESGIASDASVDTLAQPRGTVRLAGESRPLWSARPPDRSRGIDQRTSLGFSEVTG